MLPEIARTRHPSAAAEFAERMEPADLPELMDGSCTYEEFRDCLHDLAKVNRLTRAYRPTLDFLDRVAAGVELPRPLRILDVGSGGGDMLRQVANWAERRGIAVELTGVDLNPYSAQAAREFGVRDPEGRPTASKIRWITGDVFAYVPPEKIDVVLSALFTHHLSSADVVRFLGWMEEKASVGWFVNDLRRSARAARWFRVLAVMMRWHRFVRHDGPVSLQRAFRENDWRRMLAAANVPAGAAVVESHPMSRMCVSRRR